jgi:hypothetical protein
MNEKKKEQGQPVRNSAETKGEAELRGAKKNPPLTRMPSMAAVLLARSRRRITAW